MNKVLIVALAICLVGVHAFVKRDADTAAPSNTIEDFQKKANEFLENTNKNLENLLNSDTVKENTDKIKKAIDEGIANLKKAFETSTEKKA